MVNEDAEASLCWEGLVLSFLTSVIAQTSIMKSLLSSSLRNLIFPMEWPFLAILGAKNYTLRKRDRLDVQLNFFLYVGEQKSLVVKSRLVI